MCAYIYLWDLFWVEWGQEPLGEQVLTCAEFCVFLATFKPFCHTFNNTLIKATPYIQERRNQCCFLIQVKLFCQNVMPSRANPKQP